jgi:hypothetical protein
MSKLVPRSGLFQGLFDFPEFDQLSRRNLINWPFSEAPPAAFLN